MVVNVFLAGWLVYEAFREKTVYAYLGGLFVLISESALRIHANVSSDPLYITFSLVFLLAANRYMEKKSVGAAVGDDRLRSPGHAATLAGSQPDGDGWTGDPGCALEGMEVILFRDGAVDGLSLLPVAGWIYFHNIRSTRHFGGTIRRLLTPG